MARGAHLLDMSNHTIATPITTWAELRSTDREVLNRAGVAALLTMDPRTIDHAIADGTIPAVPVGRRVLIPRRQFLRAFRVDDEAPSLLLSRTGLRSGELLALSWGDVDFTKREMRVHSVPFTTTKRSPRQSDM